MAAVIGSYLLKEVSLELMAVVIGCLVCLRSVHHCESFNCRRLLGPDLISQFVTHDSSYVSRPVTLDSGHWLSDPTLPCQFQNLNLSVDWWISFYVFF